MFVSLLLLRIMPCIRLCLELWRHMFQEGAIMQLRRRNKADITCCQLLELPAAAAELHVPFLPLIACTFHCICFHDFLDLVTRCSL